jgi:hypothetical protein
VQEVHANRPLALKDNIDAANFTDAIARSDFQAGKTLGDRGFASMHGLPHLEALELRMVDVERLILAGILVDGTKCLRLGPRFEGILVLPDRMRRIEGEVLVLGSLQQMEFDESPALCSAASRG